MQNFKPKGFTEEQRKKGCEIRERNNKYNNCDQFDHFTGNYRNKKVK